MPNIKFAFVIFGLTVSATANESHSDFVAPPVQAPITAHPQRMVGDAPLPVARPWQRRQTRYVF